DGSIESALIKSARFESCPNDSYGKSRNIYALLGLTELATPRSLKVLKEVAKKECPEPLSPESLEKWTQKANRTDFEQFPACYAREGLKK
ncbi:MAG TPA: hypothetical protein DF383_01015, partial [Deltaproteobacteria bacterium]|nr:hypothetical protein [Deltaproteobacteria bacterium]